MFHFGTSSKGRKKKKERATKEPTCAKIAQVRQEVSFDSVTSQTLFGSGQETLCLYQNAGNIINRYSQLDTMNLCIKTSHPSASCGMRGGFLSESI